MQVKPLACGDCSLGLAEDSSWPAPDSALRLQGGLKCQTGRVTVGPMPCPLGSCTPALEWGLAWRDWAVPGRWGGQGCVSS